MDKCRIIDQRPSNAACLSSTWLGVWVKAMLCLYFLSFYPPSLIVSFPPCSLSLSLPLPALSPLSPCPCSLSLSFSLFLLLSLSLSFSLSPCSLSFSFLLSISLSLSLPALYMLSLCPCHNLLHTNCIPCHVDVCALCKNL